MVVFSIEFINPVKNNSTYVKSITLIDKGKFMLKHIIIFGSIFTLLPACGGGGGSKSPSTPPPTSLSSSSSSSLASSSSSSLVSSLSSSLVSSSRSSSLSSSSSSSVNPCNNTSGIIFSECFNASYGYIIGAQFSPTYIESLESTSGNQVQWSVLDTGSPQNKVLDVNFSDSSRQGQLIIGHPDSKPATQDRSQYQTGSLQFDLRVLNFGSAYNAQAGGVVFVVRMDCTWPCAAHETRIVVPALDAWMTVSLPISDLIATGLDISKISASLVLVPRGNQGGLHIQLDNVQLSKGGPVEVSPKVIFKEDFNSKTIPEWKFTNPVGNAIAEANTNYGFGAFLNMNWASTNNVLRFTTTLDRTIDISNKKASFQIICWDNTAMNFSFQMMSTDDNGETETTPVKYAMSLKTNNWYQVYADFGNIFDARHIRTIGLQFTYLGSGPNTTRCQVDTIRITE